MSVQVQAKRGQLPACPSAPYIWQDDLSRLWQCCRHETIPATLLRVVVLAHANCYSLIPWPHLPAFASSFTACIHGRRPHIATSCRIDTSLVYAISSVVVSMKLCRCSAWVLVSMRRNCFQTMRSIKCFGGGTSAWSSFFQGISTHFTAFTVACVTVIVCQLQICRPCLLFCICLRSLPASMLEFMGGARISQLLAQLTFHWSIRCPHSLCR